MKSEKKHNAKKFTLLFLSIFGHRKTVYPDPDSEKDEDRNTVCTKFLDAQCKYSWFEF
jgi:hypothetical protein